MYTNGNVWAEGYGMHHFKGMSTHDMGMSESASLVGSVTAGGSNAECGALWRDSRSRSSSGRARCSSGRRASSGGSSASSSGIGGRRHTSNSRGSSSGSTKRTRLGGGRGVGLADAAQALHLSVVDGQCYFNL
jgi:hypothetical protein